MPFVFLLSIALQIACAIHVVRSGRPLYWIWQRPRLSQAWLPKYQAMYAANTP